MDQDAYERALRARARQRRNTLLTLSAAAVIILVLGIAALIASQYKGLTGAVGVGSFIFLASAAVGAILGFLFAVPRVLSRDDTAAGVAATTANPATPGEQPKPAEEASPAQKERRLRARLLGSNTNLERISDWLTTMLVGVGLSQLGNIDDALTNFSSFLSEQAKVFESSTQAAALAGQKPLPPVIVESAGALPVIGPMLLVFGLVMGFLILYIYTRLVLVMAFNEIEGILVGDDPGRTPIVDPAARGAVAAAAQELTRGSENPAIKAIAVGGAPSVGESLNVMMGLLYRPGGYQEVIDLGGKLSPTPATRRAEYWFYLAAAFGQKHHALLAAKAPDKDILSARDNALDCARRAVELDPAFRARLWQISDPASVDNDLQDFRDDPTFRNIVGLS